MIWILIRKIRSATKLLNAWVYLAVLNLWYKFKILQGAFTYRRCPPKAIYYYHKENIQGQDYASYYVQSLKAASLFATASHLASPNSIKTLLESSRADCISLFVIKSCGNNDLKIAIDAQDSPTLANQKVHDWCDIYFKSNYWPSYDYSQKIRPIVNGNGMLSHLRLRYITEMRNRPKDLDVSCIIRIWAGGGFDPDHCLKLLAELGKLSCRKFLLAIFTGFNEDSQDLKTYIRFCTASSIPYSLKPIDYNKLIEVSARSRIVILRNGVSSCIPWRFLDMLCLGACVVFDHQPLVAWPDPLLCGIHYLALDLPPMMLGRKIDSQRSTTSPSSFSRIRLSLEAYLKQDSLVKRVGLNALSYYQSSCSPREVGMYILSDSH